MRVNEGVTIATAARRVGRARPTVSAAVSAGRIPAAHSADGAVVLVRLADVEAWAAADRPRGRPRKSPAQPADAPASSPASSPA